MTTLIKSVWILMLFIQEKLLGEDSVTNQLFDFSILKSVGLVPSIIVLIIMVYLLIKFLRIVFKQKQKLEKLKCELEKVKSENQRELNLVNKKINDLINKNQNQNSNVVKIPPHSFVKEEPSEPITLEIKKEVIQPEPEQNVKYYFSTPYLDNKFLITDGKTAPNEKTIYCISNDTLMLYDNINSEAMNSAINSMDLVIKTACQVINSKEPNHSEIRMVQAGKVIKEAEDYTVLEKVKVKFQ